MAGISDWKVSAPWEAYKGITKSPLVGAAGLYGAGALGLYFAGPTAVRAIANMYGKTMSSSDRNAMMQDLEENMPSIRKRIAFGLPIIPAIMQLASAYDSRLPDKGLLSWNDPMPEGQVMHNLDKARMNLNRRQSAEAAEREKRDKAWASGAEAQSGIPKKSSFDPYGFRPLPDSRDDVGSDSIMSQPTIPYDHSVGLIHKDPVLGWEQKGKLLNVFDHAQNAGAPWLTPRDVAQGAIRLGVGAIAGNYVGRAVGKIFGLPQQLTSRLSTTGAIGGALINLGIV